MAYTSPKLILHRTLQLGLFKTIHCVSISCPNFWWHIMSFNLCENRIHLLSDMFNWRQGVWVDYVITTFVKTYATRNAEYSKNHYSDVFGHVSTPFVPFCFHFSTLFSSQRIGRYITAATGGCSNGLTQYHHTVQCQQTWAIIVILLLLNFHQAKFNICSSDV